MALNGIFSNTYQGYTYEISWVANQDIQNNSSTITCTHKLNCRSGYSLSIYPRSITCIINDDKKSFASSTIDITGPKTVTLGTTTHVVNHNSDGSGKFSITASFNIQATINGTYVNSITVTDEATLDIISRSSTITSASNIVIGNKCNIKWTPSNINFKYKLSFSIGSWSHTTDFISPNKITSYTYESYTILGDTIKNNTTIYDELPNSTSGKMTVTLYTYDKNGVKIGDSDSKTFTITIPSTIKPKVGNIKLTPLTYDNLIRGKNKLQIDVTNSIAGTGSSIKSYKFSGVGISTTTSSSSIISAGNITPSSTSDQTLTYTVTVTDSRGRTDSKTAEITCYAYSSPRFKSFVAYRVDENGNANNKGTLIKCEYTLSFSSINNSNSISVKLMHKKSTAGSYSPWNVLQDSTATSGSSTLGLSNPISLDTTYTMYAEITDKYNGISKSGTITVFGQDRAINITSDGTGIAIGKMAESSQLFECKWPAQFDNVIKFGNNGAATMSFGTSGDSDTIYLMTGQNTSANDKMGLAIAKHSVFIINEKNDGVINLGSANRRWNQLYAANSTISTSDKNLKKDIKDMSDIQEQFFNELKPVTYKMKNGTSDRTHYGFISQDVENALLNVGLEGKDFAGFCKDVRTDEGGKKILDENGNEIYDYSLRYAEFIALNTYMIHTLQEKIRELENTIKELKETS